MIDADLLAQYRANRAQGMAARHALPYARSIVSPDLSGLTWDDNYPPSGTGEIDGFTVTATCVSDDDYQGPGTFEDGRTDDYGRAIRPNPDAVDARSAIFWVQGQARWFTPEITEAEHYRSLVSDCKMGKAQARAEARSYVQSDMRMAARPEAYGLVVKVTKNGVPLGEAAIWGYSVDWEESHERNRAMLLNGFAEHGLVEEALDEARETLAALVEA